MVERRIATQPQQVNAYLLLHGAVLLFALCALFGKWITAAPLIIVFGRSFFASLAIAAWCYFNQHSLKVSKAQLKHFAVSGSLLALHWWCFFYAISNSTVTLGLITFACFPIFVCLIEPVIGQAKWQKATLLQALLCLLGVSLVVTPHAELGLPTIPLIIGLLSALTFALLTLFNKVFVNNNSPLQISFYQNLFAAIVLIPWLVSIDTLPTHQDMLLLVLLGVIFTALAHTMLITSLIEMSAFMASLTVSLEPIYGTVAAVLLLNEPLNVSITLGACLVIWVNIWASKKASHR